MYDRGEQFFRCHAVSIKKTHFRQFTCRTISVNSNDMVAFQTNDKKMKQRERTFEGLCCRRQCFSTIVGNNNNKKHQCWRPKKFYDT